MRAIYPKRVLTCVLAMLAVFALCPATAESYTYYETYEQQIGQIRGTYSLEMWHHSGGYWMVGNGTNKRIKVTDHEIEKAGITGYLNATQYAKWVMELPSAVKKAIADGRKVTVKLSDNPTLYKSAYCEIIGGKYLHVYAKPVFHVAKTATLNSFVKGIKVTIPLVNMTYGRNLYSIYSIGRLGARGVGLFCDASPGKVYEPYIHPSQITNSLGWLKSGIKIHVGGKTISSAGCTVGLLTLAHGGAVGLEFDFPIKATFYVQQQKTVTVPDPEPEAEEKAQKSDSPGPPKSSDSEEKPKASGSAGKTKSPSTSKNTKSTEGAKKPDTANSAKRPAGSGGTKDSKNSGAGSSTKGSPGRSIKNKSPSPDISSIDDVPFDINEYSIHRLY